MSRRLIAGIETGGTKILARVCDRDNGDCLGERRWPTRSAGEAANDIGDFLSSVAGEGRLAAIGLAAFGPLIVDPASKRCGEMLATPKPGWAGSNLRLALQSRFQVPVLVETDVGAAAIAEQAIGAGRQLASIAYVTVGTGIGAGLAINGSSLKGALHPEAGHMRLCRLPGDDVPSVCPFHSDCAEGLVSGPAVQRRIGEGKNLADDPAAQDLVATYLGQLATLLVLAWSPHRIVWGGGVMTGAPLIAPLASRLREMLGGYGVGPAVDEPEFCVAAQLEDAGLEGAIIIARECPPARSPNDPR
ncbi:MAG: ROK family protein [Sphingomonas sp.]|nr:ROK family protein [Sphingomonas sp.]